MRRHLALVGGLALGLALGLQGRSQESIPGPTPGQTPSDTPPVDPLDLRAKFAELDSARGARLEQLAAELAAHGAQAAALALEPRPFAALPLEARRARSGLVREIGGEASIAAAIAALEDPDPIVRGNLSAFLASPILRETAAEERAAALAQLARELDDAEERAEAVRALGRIDHPAAARELAELLRTTHAGDQAAAARALGAHARARELVVELVRAGVAGRGELSNEALIVLLLEAYGRDLAELPSGGAAPADRLPFELGAVHPDARVRAAARIALQRFQERAIALGAPDRADQVLAALAGSGLDAFELGSERIRLALREGGNLEQALGLARELIRRHPPGNDPLLRQRRAESELLATATLLELGRGRETEPLLADAEATLAALRRERWDLTRDPEELDLGELAPESLLALVSTYRALVELAQGAEASDVRVLEAARQADVWFLQAQLALTRRVPGIGLILSGNSTHDELFQHELGPTALVLGGGRSGTGSERWLELEAKLYQAFATVTGGLIPGFEPIAQPDARLADPLTDVERRDLLAQLLAARHESALREIQRRIDELDPRSRHNAARRGEEAPRALDPADEMRIEELMYLRERLLRMHQNEQNEGEAALRRLRGLTRSGVLFAERLRENNRHATARRIAERAVADLEASRGSDLTFARTLAHAESTLGSIMMDQGEPAEAEKVFARALERLEGGRRDALSQDDRQAAAAVESQLANVLVSLAVNANVKMHAPEKALGYFERAFELDQSDFMRVLLACYRARAGRSDEARAALRDLPVAPGNYYNLACTHALLGEKELAFDYLARDFSELRTERGARERQKQWARDDPDLVSLRDDPRFQELVRSEPQPPEIERK